MLHFVLGAVLVAPVVAVVVFLVIHRNPKTVAKIEADATVVAKQL